MDNNTLEIIGNLIKCCNASLSMDRAFHTANIFNDSSSGVDDEVVNENFTKMYNELLHTLIKDNTPMAGEFATQLTNATYKGISNEGKYKNTIKVLKEMELYYKEN